MSLLRVLFSGFNAFTKGVSHPTGGLVEFTRKTERYPGVLPLGPWPDPVPLVPVQIPNSTPEEARTVFVLSEGGVQIGFADLAFGELLPVHVSVGNVRGDAVIPLALLRQMRDHLNGVLQRAAENPEPAA